MGRAEGHAVGWRAARRAKGAGTKARHASGVTDNWMARTRQGWWAPEERAATSVRRAGGEATLRALACPAYFVDGDESSARSVASAAARFAGRGPFLALRRCEGETCVLRRTSFAAWELLA